MGAKAIKLCSCDKSVRFIKIYVNHVENGVVCMDCLILLTKKILMLVVKLKKKALSIHFMGKKGDQAFKMKAIINQ